MIFRLFSYLEIRIINPMIFFCFIFFILSSFFCSLDSCSGIFLDFKKIYWKKRRDGGLRTAKNLFSENSLEFPEELISRAIGKGCLLAYSYSIFKLFNHFPCLKPFATHLSYFKNLICNYNFAKANQFYPKNYLKRFLSFWRNNFFEFLEFLSFRKNLHLKKFSLRFLLRKLIPANKIWTAHLWILIRH